MTIIGGTDCGERRLDSRLRGNDRKGAAIQKRGGTGQRNRTKAAPEEVIK